jgi:hypothetical protein
MAPAPAALFTRSQPHRNGLCQTQGPPTPDRRTHLRQPHHSHRNCLQPLQPRRLPELHRACRLCRKVNAKRFSMIFAMPDALAHRRKLCRPKRGGPGPISAGKSSPAPAFLCFFATGDFCRSSRWTGWLPWKPARTGKCRQKRRQRSGPSAHFRPKSLPTELWTSKASSHN